ISSIEKQTNYETTFSSKLSPSSSSPTSLSCDPEIKSATFRRISRILKLLKRFTVRMNLEMFINDASDDCIPLKRCLRNIARIFWDDWVSNIEVRRRVLENDSKSVDEVVNLHRLRWLGHVLRMPEHRLPRRGQLKNFRYRVYFSKLLSGLLRNSYYPLS
ncbi:unnamed protein product, partial [Schistosoma mattheei]